MLKKCGVPLDGAHIFYFMRKYTIAYSLFYKIFSIIKSINYVLVKMFFSE